MSAQPSVRELATEVEALSGTLAEILNTLESLQRGMLWVQTLGQTADGRTLSINIAIIRDILVREFGFA